MPSKFSIPSEFIASIYRANYADLRKFNDVELLRHFDSFGRTEGRAASQVSGRTDFMAIAKGADSVLEIGPFAHPVAGGPNVKYFDIMDRRRLIERAVSLGIDPHKIPEIDYVSPSCDLTIITEKFDVVISSHCIEHQPDLVAHLSNVANLLNAGGLYLLIIPDKRYCFDHYNTASNIHEIVAAHIERRTVHTAKSVVEHRLLITHNDPVRHWSGDHGEKPVIKKDGIDKVSREWSDTNGGYIDVHAWQFTPETFEKIATDLVTLGLSKLEPARMYGTYRNSLEFYSVLRLSG